MDATSVRAILEEELASGAKIRGSTGIRRDNLATFLVEPYPVQASGGGKGAVRHDVWVVLELEPCVPDTSLVAWDPPAAAWAVLERDQDGRLRVAERAVTFADAVAAL